MMIIFHTSTLQNLNILFFFFKGTICTFPQDFIYWERGRETSMCGCLLHTPTGDLANNPGMCPDWESNRQPFGSQAGAQSTEPHQPGLNNLKKYIPSRSK